MSENLNIVMNGTQPSGCYWNHTAGEIGMTFAYCLIFLVSLAGNTVVGIIVYKTKTMRKPINFFIVNMAMSDLLFPIFLIPREIQLLYIDSWLIGGPLGQALCKLVIFLSDVSLIVSIQSLVLIAVDRFAAVVYPLRSPLITMRRPINFLIVNMAMSDLLFHIFGFPYWMQTLYIDFWLIGGPLGQALCKLTYYLPYVSLIVSIQSLVLIAVDRFGAVVYPLRSPLISSKLCPFFILATWIVAMAIQSPELVALKLVEYPGGLVCSRHWNEAFGESWSVENYYVLILVIFFIIPLMLIAILYIIIYLKVKSQKIPGEELANFGQQRLQRKRNVLKMAFAIVLGFAVCWLPLIIFWFLFFFTSDIWSCGSQYFIIVAFFMARANCAINPCICFIFSRNYREGLNNLLRLRCSFKVGTHEGTNPCN
ncbi:neuropeptide FF receptor 2-like [Orbicella faveolata]|uniref:neuropeptide FF receptor 2-like n=1 Tax=Orbicella faveolata TaxID=48498 RepID=UPI0009E29F57|nr:neuropeptide FF receptor 2-like [Orbicella faveolata]